jgi:hypothetical protein
VRRECGEEWKKEENRLREINKGQRKKYESGRERKVMAKETRVSPLFIREYW